MRDAAHKRAYDRAYRVANLDRERPRRQAFDARDRATAKGMLRRMRRYPKERVG